MNTDIKILVVDDFSSMRRIIKRPLLKTGFKNIFDAADGKIAFEILQKEKIDLILSDWNMPNMSGIELLRAVKEDESLKHIPFVMVTAEGLKEFIIEAAKAGVNNYITKPFTDEELLNKLAIVIDKYL